MESKSLKYIIYFGVLVFFLGLVLTASAQQPRVKSLNKQVKKEIPHHKQIKSERERLIQQKEKITANLVTLKKIAKEKAPASLNRKEKKQWKELSEWLESVIQTYSQKEKSLNAVISDSKKLAKKNSDTRSQENMLEQMNQMNMEFLQLQNSMQMESRQFNTVSNALKVRHDAAQAAIRNMK